MPTELRYGYNLDIAHTDQLGYCVQEPKDVLKQLGNGFRIHHFKKVTNPFGVGEYWSYRGLFIIKGFQPRGTEITGKLEDYKELLENFKLRPIMSKYSILSGLVNAIKGDLLTQKEGRTRNFIELCNEEREKLPSECKEYLEANVATFKEIVEVTLGIENPTEEDLKDILAGRTRKGISTPRGKRVELTFTDRDLRDLDSLRPNRGTH